MKRRIRKAAAIILFVLSLICTGIPAEAAAITSEQRKITNTVDYFVDYVIMNTCMDTGGNVSKKEYLQSMKKHYNGKLTTKAKSAIAASQTKGYKWKNDKYLFPGEIGSVSSSKVKVKYKQLFGKNISKINLPVKKAKNLKKWYLDFSKSKTSKTVYWYSGYETETKFSTKITGVKKTEKNTYTVTKKYKFYKHWAQKKPDYTFTVKVKLKKNAKSPYKYNITGLTIQ